MMTDFVLVSPDGWLYLNAENTLSPVEQKDTEPPRRFPNHLAADTAWRLRLRQFAELGETLIPLHPEPYDKIFPRSSA